MKSITDCTLSELKEQKRLLKKLLAESPETGVFWAERLQVIQMLIKSKKHVKTKGKAK